MERGLKSAEAWLHCYDRGLSVCQYDWDDEKSEINRRKHGIGFDAIHMFEWRIAMEDIDDRADYGELREIATSFIGVGLFTVIFTRRDGQIRLISLNKASNQEKQDYVDWTR